jgi:hypothetical protein
MSSSFSAIPMMRMPPALVMRRERLAARTSSKTRAPRVMPPWTTRTETADRADADPQAGGECDRREAVEQGLGRPACRSRPRSPSSIEPSTVSGPTQKSSDAVKKPSLSVEVEASPRANRAWRRSPTLLQAVLDAQELTRDPAEQDAPHHVQEVRVAPGQRVVDAEHERRQPQPKSTRWWIPAGKRPPSSVPIAVPTRMVATLMSVPVTKRAG